MPLLEFLDEITETLDQGEDVDVIYFDFSKASSKSPINVYALGAWNSRTSIDL